MKVSLLRIIAVCLHRVSDKVQHSRVRAAFVTPGATSHTGLHIQTNDNDLPFMLMMQQQENTDQQSQRYNETDGNSKTDCDTSEESDNDLAPDDFLLVEVVSKFLALVIQSFEFSRNHSLVEVKQQMI